MVKKYGCYRFFYKIKNFDLAGKSFFSYFRAILYFNMTAIIIEDEALAARELESILKKLAPEIEIVARQDSVRGSVQWLKENQVDLIFSDVHLGDGRSFDIFGQVEIKAPVIFLLPLMMNMLCKLSRARE